MELTYRQAKRAHEALQEIAIIRDRGIKQSEDGNTSYVGKLVLPRKAKMVTRKMLGALEPVVKQFTDERAELVEGVNQGDADELVRLDREIRVLLDMKVPDGVEVLVLRATHLGDDALDHIPPSLLVNLGPLFEDDEDEEDGAGDPRNREERRTG